jgi:RNA polymerase sigma-70 factor (ECF subfamily)
MGDTQPMCTAGLAGAYQTQVQAVYAFIYRGVGNREAAERLTSRVFLRAERRIEPPSEEPHPAERLYVWAREAVHAYWHGDRGTAVRDLDAGRPARQQPAAARDAAPGQAAGDATALLARLPAEYGTVLRCRLVQGLSAAETARRMGLAETDIRALQQRALAAATRLRQAETATGWIDRGSQAAQGSLPAGDPFIGEG